MAQKFELRYSEGCRRALEDLRGSPSMRKKRRRVELALEKLANDPLYPSLRSHKHVAVNDEDGVGVFGSYVEHHTPSAWRLLWRYGPGEGEITVLGVGPHP
ncbi:MULTISPECIES: hypothetical protein [Mycetocola]|uniref:Type II toxin-antitoxin system RelE/ParE family toxin n=1 Tax=Mycetocola lacteus TaxID=76637 RepID=A0A3L7AJG2_9MICO|nr:MULTISPECIES: hypothetical protein [Mycetocola]MCS4276814.1 hypothetical protein [Mycetocola sp. BIGb0189]RLP79850.1 hypothetical protein D9V34_15000 [Mycetocola lacteus]